MLEAVQYYHVLHIEACRKHKSKEAKELAIHKWIATTVNPSLHSSTLETIRAETGRREVTLRESTKKLKESFSPGLMVLTAETATQYKELLNDARWANTSPDKWSEKWNTVYQKAMRLNINEVQGVNAIQDFIQAVGAQFEPTWAEAKKVKLVEYNSDLPDNITLKSVAEEFMRYRKATRVFDQDHGKGIHATLGNQSNKPTHDNASKGTRKNVNCPCGFTHTWKPQLCRTLLYAITGELVNKKRTPSKDLCEKIKQRYESPKWEALRTIINNEGWSKSDAQPKGQFPGRVSAAVIDPGILEKFVEPQIVYTTTSKHHHLLATSTLFDNCGAMHVVNDSSYFEPGTLRHSFDSDDYLEAGTTSFTIKGRGTRIIKNILNGEKGPCTEDLVLQHVAYVPGFHVHIVSESKLIE
ncbi:hypothetical protein E4U15_004192 [Claviceps sp. LM218 group G6]|nr:hypothetical protein E4U15_004192 [Claviceps sp. LM218 group G6]